jgi:hypothetical protein
VKSTAELEAEMLAKMPKFKARPLNKKVSMTILFLCLFTTTKTPIVDYQDFKNAYY